MPTPEEMNAEIEKLMSQFRSDVSSVASGAVSSIADAMVLPLKLPLPVFKAVGDAIAQAPKPAGLPGLPDPLRMFGAKKEEGTTESKTGAGFPELGWTGQAPKEKLTFLSSEGIGM
jgi:hypothetical protein